MLRAVPSHASEPDVPEADDREASGAMHSYFEGEKLGGWLLVGMGVAGLGSGGVLITQDSPTARGASYPLLGVGAVHVLAGLFVNLSSRRRITRFDDQISKDVDAFVRGEEKRIKGVRTQFLILKITEVVLIAGGGAMIAIGERSDRPRLTGIGIGVAIEAAATLVFDIVAARRAARYHDYLRLNVTEGPTGETYPTLTYRLAF
jgi:hypothetical protein